MEANTNNMTGSLWITVVDEKQRSLPGKQVQVRVPEFWMQEATTAEDGLARFPEVPFSRAEVSVGGVGKQVWIRISRLVEVELQIPAVDPSSETELFAEPPKGDRPSS